jgi:hypothetical protein
MAAERKSLAEQFFRGVYGGDPSVVDDLAGDDIVISYPIFETLFGTSVIRGREDVKDFATGFRGRWADIRIAIHESVAEEDRVILVWDFRARRVSSGAQGEPPADPESRWGGITLYRFDGAGKIVEEIGEESAPGPIQRMAADGGD